MVEGISSPVTTQKKWLSHQTNVLVGQIVILAEDNTPPSQWAIGKIIKTYPGPDDLIRVVDVRTNYKVFRRPIHKLGLLPIIDNEEGAVNVDATTSTT